MHNQGSNTNYIGAQGAGNRAPGMELLELWGGGPPLPWWMGDPTNWRTKSKTGTMTLKDRPLVLEGTTQGE